MKARGRPVDHDFRLALPEHVQPAAGDPDLAVKTRLEQQRQLEHQILEDGPASHRVVLAVDRRVAWQRVVGVVDDAARLGFTDVYWAFPVHSESSEPAPSMREAVQNDASLARSGALHMGDCNLFDDAEVGDLASVDRRAQHAVKYLRSRRCNADTAVL